MGLMGWVGLVAGLIALAYISAIVAGGLLPSRSVAATMIRNELHRQQLTGISEPCIAELAKQMVNFIEFQVRFGLKKGPVNSLIEDEVKVVCLRVSCIVMGDDDYSAEMIRKGIAKGTPELVWQVLAKQQPEFFSLENLEKTQAINSVNREILLRPSSRTT